MLGTTESRLSRLHVATLNSSQEGRDRLGANLALVKTRKASKRQCNYLGNRPTDGPLPPDLKQLPLESKHPVPARNSDCLPQTVTLNGFFNYIDNLLGVDRRFGGSPGGDVPSLQEPGFQSQTQTTLHPTESPTLGLLLLGCLEKKKKKRKKKKEEKNRREKKSRGTVTSNTHIARFLRGAWAKARRTWRGAGGRGKASLKVDPFINLPLVKGGGG